MDKSRDFVKIREAARGRGDWNLVRAMSVELDRLGYRDHPVVEAATLAMPERAVPDRPRRGRPPRPRCEHGRIPDRCVDCQEEVD